MFGPRDKNTKNEVQPEAEETNAEAAAAQSPQGRAFGQPHTDPARDQPATAAAWFLAWPTEWQW